MKMKKMWLLICLIIAGVMLAAVLWNRPGTDEETPAPESISEEADEIINDETLDDDTAEHKKDEQEAYVPEEITEESSDGSAEIIIDEDAMEDTETSRKENETPDDVWD